jgi:hypothetical protein
MKRLPIILLTLLCFVFSGRAQNIFGINNNNFKTNGAADITTTNSKHIFVIEPKEKQLMWVSVTGPNNLYNEILLGFFEGATTGIDQGYDAYKLKGNPDIALYSLMDGYTEGFAIQSLPPITGKTEVKLGLDIGIAGSYTFKIKNTENFNPQVDIYLEDLVSGTITDLKKDSSYQVILNPEVYKSRFLLQFYPNKIITNVDKITLNALEIYTYNNKIFIKGKVNTYYPVIITDITGRLAGSYIIKTGSVNEISPEGLAGIYFVSVVTDKGIVTKKIFCNSDN